MGKGKSKGTGYEREVSRLLSEWWTNGKRDDIFWRSDSSGARATFRSKSGQSTFGQYGDIAAIDPIGQPLIELCTIEVKRGYSKAKQNRSKPSMMDAIDRLEGTNPTVWEEFIEKAIEDHQQAGSFSWMLIAKRDQKRAMVFMDTALMKEFRNAKAFKRRPVPSCRFCINTDNTVYGVLLDTFFEQVTREQIEEMVTYL